MSDRLTSTLALLRQTPIGSLLQYGSYMLQLKTGMLRRRTPPRQVDLTQIPQTIPGTIPALYSGDQLELIRSYTLIDDALPEQAEEILAGRHLRFGLQSAPIEFRTGFAQQHWTEISDNLPNGQDIKLIWDPARFDWAFTLARAYVRTSDPRYPEKIMSLLTEFLSSAPVNCGPNWVSGQEAGLRLINLAMAATLCASWFADHLVESQQLGLVLSMHAERIRPTLSYAIAQNNNHILSEAAALYTASVFCQWHPDAADWERQCYQLFNRFISRQIDSDGEYVQHSTTYQRLAITLTLWMNKLFEFKQVRFETQAAEKISLAGSWLSNEVDHASGKANNLGHNDGSWMFGLAGCGYQDYRPVLAAFPSANSMNPALPEGPWNEYISLFGIAGVEQMTRREASARRIVTSNGWARLRTLNTSTRPAHADLLHADIWHRGINVACDAGTYRYSAPAQWQNTLRANQHHNTLDTPVGYALQPSGRFRWTGDAVTTKVAVNHANGQFFAVQDGFRGLGYRHQRTLRSTASGWEVIDQMELGRGKSAPITFEMNWLLADTGWEIQNDDLVLTYADFTARVSFRCQGGEIVNHGIARAGVRQHGEFSAPETFGWVSPTYDMLVPALSCRHIVNAKSSFEITTTFIFSH